jgi:alpha-galactosidase
MTKITFMGAGSTVFAKSNLGDCMLTECLHDAHFALYDIDAQRLDDSRLMLENLNRNINQNRATISTHLGVANRQAALKDAGFVINAIQVGGYEPSTVIDFDIPKKFGLRQTIADTLGIGGIFRSLRTIPVVLDFCHDMEKVCPDAIFLNYVNPMAMITGGILQGSNIQAIGLCHSVQVCATKLLNELDLLQGVKDLRWEIAGLNHQAWLLSIHDGKKDLYPTIKAKAKEYLTELRQRGGKKVADELTAKAKAEGFDWANHYWKERRNKASAEGRHDHEAQLYMVAHDMVRLEIMLNFGHYITESSEHYSEYCPYFIKSTAPQLIDEFNIPLDEYPRRCVSQIAGWKKQRETLVGDKALTHNRSHEFGAGIIEAVVTDKPYRVHGSVMNKNLITNLPAKACVEVACLIDKNGVQPTIIGDLPEQLAALNRTNINPQILTVEAALTGKKDLIYQAAMLDPHTSAELTLDQIRALCDELIAAHGDYLPKFR